jgi:hypothetical protein
VVLRQPWDGSGRHGQLVRLTVILMVFYVLFWVGVITVVTENKLRSIIVDTPVQFPVLTT